MEAAAGREDYHPIFIEAGVDMVFNGHAHNYERIEKDGVVYLVLGGGGAVPRGLSPTRVECSVVAVENHNFYARVTGALGALLLRHGIRALSRGEFTVWEIPERPPRIAIVAHGGTNAVALAHLLDVRPVPWEWLRFESELAAFSVLQARDIGPDGCVWSLQNFNELDHSVED
jgi:hypothetical protein